MDTQDTSGSGTREITGNVMRLAIVVFFVATISIASGFLQGNQLAVVDTNNNVAAVDAGLGALKDFNCTATYCTQPDGAGGNNTITCPGTSGACTLKTSPSDGGESFDLDAQTSKNMRSAMETIRTADAEGGCTGANRFSPRCLDKCTTSFIAVQGGSEPITRSCIEQPGDPVRDAIDKVVYYCPQYGGNWRNVWQDYQCNATPRTDGAQTPSSPQTPAQPDIQNSVQIGTDTNVAAALAAERSSVWINPDTGRPSSESDAGGNSSTWINPDTGRPTTGASTSGPVSKECAAAKVELATAIKQSLQTGKKAQGGTPTELSCRLGATVCFLSAGLSTTPAPAPNTSNNSQSSTSRSALQTVSLGFVSNITTSGDVKCCNKHDQACINQFTKALGIPGLGTAVPSQPQQPQVVQNQCDDLRWYNSARCRLQQGGWLGGGRIQDTWGTIADQLGLSLGLGLGRLGFSFDWFGDDDDDVYDRYRGSSGGGSSTVVPQCVIAASNEFINAGETVTVRWRTSDADTVSISNLGDDVEKNDQKSVTPYKTTTYRLTAKNGGTTQMCDVTVNVRGSFGGDPTGVAPPRLSCLPSLIQPDEESTIKWQCTGEAESTESEGIDTDGEVSGEITVDPSHNSEYSVSCLDEEGEEIGKNVCSVRVGEPLYDFVVHPTTAARGDQVRVSWASVFMKSCRVTGPRGFDYTRPQGVVITQPFAQGENQTPGSNIRAAVYTIECDSQFGGSYSRDVEVTFENDD